MARPSPIIKHSIEVGDGSLWEILAAETYFAITYQDQPISIRITTGSLTGNNHKYKKMTYTHLGSAEAQCRKLNHRFKCQDFKVMMIGN